MRGSLLTVVAVLTFFCVRAQSTVATLPAPNLENLAAEDALVDPTKTQPWRFGVNYDLDITRADLAHLGGTIEAPGATSINLLFENFRLHPGAVLLISDQNNSIVHRLTHLDNTPNGKLPIDLIAGSTLKIEFSEASGHQQTSTWRISRATYGYRSVTQYARDLNDAQSCHINTSCPEGDSLRSPIQSVGLIIVGGNGICSGALVNNSCNNRDPYFLTANHCLDGNEDTWLFRFNWESPTCPTTSNGPTNQVITGASVAASHTNSDFALLRLDAPIPEDWEVTFAGWDRSDIAPDSCFTVHHPAGDVRKITFDTDSTTAASSGGVTVWQVLNWELGSTEGGSSGAPLFNTQGRIVGQLSGGLADCTNNLDDNFGRFDASWDFGGTSATQLENWLDGCNTNAMSINSWPPVPVHSLDASIHFVRGIDAQVCGDSIYPSLILRNSGFDTLVSLDIIYQLDALGPQFATWNGALATTGLDTVFLPALGVATGFHTFTLSIDNPNAGPDADLVNNAYNISFSATNNGVAVALDLLTDIHPHETIWNIKDSAGIVKYAGGPYLSSENNQLISRNFCLEPGCYTYTIIDQFGDGLSGGDPAQHGDYGLYYPNGDTLVEPDQIDFGFNATHLFCVSPDCSEGIPQIEFWPDSVSCTGGADGEVFAEVTGGANPISYSWDDPENQVGSSADELESGLFTLTITDSLGCMNAGQVWIGEPDSALVLDTLIMHETESLMDGSIQLSIGGGTTPYLYLWNTGDTDSQLNNLSQGWYTVTVTDAQGCTISDSLLVDGPSGINSTGSNSLVRIFPNPVENALQLQLSGIGNSAQLTLYDAMGRSIMQQAVQGTRYVIAVQDLPAGIYFLQFGDGETSIVKRIVKR